MQKETSGHLSDFYECLALDIGGVICADTWENLFLTPETGLAARYGLDPEMVKKTGKDLWRIYAYAERSEEDYWRSWEEILQQKIDRKLIAELYEQAIWVDPSAAAVIAQCLSRGMEVAFVSNSTSFWFPRQMKLAGLEDLEPRVTNYLSHEIGFSKVHERGGLPRLAAATRPETILYVDDRHENIEVARNLGMTAFHYKREAHQGLAKALKSLTHPKAASPPKPPGR